MMRNTDHKVTLYVWENVFRGLYVAGGRWRWRWRTWRFSHNVERTSVQLIRSIVSHHHICFFFPLVFVAVYGIFYKPSAAAAFGECVFFVVMHDHSTPTALIITGRVTLVADNAVYVCMYCNDTGTNHSSQVGSLSQERMIRALLHPGVPKRTKLVFILCVPAPSNLCLPSFSPPPPITSAAQATKKPHASFSLSPIWNKNNYFKNHISLIIIIFIFLFIIIIIIIPCFSSQKWYL